MTIEQKAKAYDEVVNKLKGFIMQGVDPLITRADVQDFFPELKESESEDEESKKWILEYLYDGLRKSDEQFKGQFKTAIAWLEKQAPVEHFELKMGHWYMCHRAYCCRADHLSVQEGERFQCEKDGVVKGFAIKDPEKYFIEVHAPAHMEDDQNDKVRCRSTIQVLEYARSLDNYNQYGKADIDKNIAWLEKQGEKKPTDAEMKELLRTEYEKGRADAIAETQVAWSEEDEEYLAACIEVIDNFYKLSREIEAFTKINVFRKGYAEKLKSWLKSLRPHTWTKEDKERYISCLKRLSTGNPEQPETINSKWFKEHVYPQKQWKPSKEQIDALDSTLQYNQVSHNSLEHLNSLYNDLKKLKEE